MSTSDFTTFNTLDLSGVSADTGGQLRAGNYVCRIDTAKMDQNKNKTGRNVVIDFVDIDTGGTTTTWLAIDNPNESAQESARRKLKALLIYSNHPTPDRPGDIISLMGLRVGVRMEPNQYMHRETGELKMGAQVADRAPFFSPDDKNVVIGAMAVPAQQGRPNGAAQQPGTDVPF